MRSFHRYIPSSYLLYPCLVKQPNKALYLTPENVAHFRVYCHVLRVVESGTQVSLADMLPRW
jgi:hypothetical protein